MRAIYMGRDDAYLTHGKAYRIEYIKSLCGGRFYRLKTDNGVYMDFQDSYIKHLFQVFIG